MSGIVSIMMFSHAERSEDSTGTSCFESRMIREGLLRWGLSIHRQHEATVRG